MCTTLARLDLGMVDYGGGVGGGFLLFADAVCVERKLFLALSFRHSIVWCRAEWVVYTLVYRTPYLVRT